MRVWFTCLVFSCTGLEPAASVEQSPSGDTDATPTGDGGGTPVDTSPPKDTAPDTSGEPVDDDREEPTVTEETVADHTTDDSWIFVHDSIHTVDITLSKASEAALEADPYAYAEAEVSFDGIEMAPVGMRLRGKIGSYRSLSGKPKIKIDFNQYIEDQRFYGLETIGLNNAVVDCGYLREPIAYKVFEAAGVPASRTGFASVTINGEAYGLYILTEVPDDRFLARHWPDPTGNLYDGKYVWYGGYSYTLLDFGIAVDHLYSLEEGVDNGNSDIIDVSNAINDAWSGSDFYNDLDPYIDWDAVLLMLSGEQFVGQNDGYAMNRNNYRVYFDPEDGQLEFIPWDMDYSSLQDSEWGRSWSSPYGRLANRCMSDTNCQAAWKVAAEQVTDAAESLDLIGAIDDMCIVIGDTAINDPKRECSLYYYDYYQMLERNFYIERVEYMRTFWGL
jgi:CotH kinase protein